MRPEISCDAAPVAVCEATFDQVGEVRLKMAAVMQRACADQSTLVQPSLGARARTAGHLVIPLLDSQMIGWDWHLERIGREINRH